MRWHKYNKNRTGLKLAIFAVLAAALILAAVFADRLCPYDPYMQDLGLSMNAPSAGHIFGTDRYGRDVFSRVIMGGRISITAALMLTAAVASIGTLIGIVCGISKGALSDILMRISDLFLAFPSLVLAIAVAGLLGGGMFNAGLALCAAGWPKYARLARSLTLSQKNAEYVTASRLQCTSVPRIIMRHILPNIAGPLIVTAVLDIGTMMMELSGLSFLGLGVKLPAAEWGSMINEGRSMLHIAPWMALAPGMAIFITVMIFNLLGDTLRDYLDPVLRHEKEQHEERHRIEAEHGRKPSHKI